MDTFSWCLRQQLRPDPPNVFGVEVARGELSLPGLPVLKLRHGIVPLEPAEALPLLRFVAAGHGPGALVEEGVAVPGSKRNGPLLLLRWLEAIQQPASAIHVEHGRVAPHTAGPDLCGGDAPLLPVAGQMELKSSMTSCSGSFRSSASCLGTQSMSGRSSKALTKIWSPAKSW